MAIQIAVKLGDLKIVRMLVEHQNLGSPNSGSLGIGIDIPSKWVETAVRSGSDEIVSYFVHEKGESSSLPIYVFFIISACTALTYQG